MSWHNYTCSLSDRDVQVLISDAFVSSRPSDTCPHLIWVGIWGHLPHEGAFWHPDESEALDDLEDALREALSGTTQSTVVYAFRLAAAGIREYFFYCSEPSSVLSAGKAWALSRPEYRIEFDQLIDPAWREYQKYAVLNQS